MSPAVTYPPARSQTQSYGLVDGVLISYIFPSPSHASHSNIGIDNGPLKLPSSQLPY